MRSGYTSSNDLRKGRKTFQNRNVIYSSRRLSFSPAYYGKGPVPPGSQLSTPSHVAQPSWDDDTSDRAQIHR